MSFNLDITNCEFVPLTSLLSFIVDNRGKSAPTCEEGIPLIATNCIKNDELYPVFERIRYVSSETYNSWFRAHPKPGDIIFVNKGTPGRVCLVPDPVNFCIAQDMMAFRVNNEKIYNRYLFAVLRSQQFQAQILNYHVGTMIPHFKKGDLDKLLIPVPAYKVQKFIGDLYFTFSQKIEVNNQINKTLVAMAQVIFKHWFIDFEFPNEDGEPYKSNGGEMVESELGRIPKGWEIVKLSDLGNIITGKTPSGKQLDGFGDKYCFITPKDLDSSMFIIKSERFLSDIGAERLKNIKVKANSIGVSCIGSNLGEVYITAEDGFTNQQINSLILYKEEIYPYIFITLRNMKQDFLNIAGGSAVPIINKTTFSAIQIINPDDETLYAFLKVVTVMFETIKTNLNQNLLLKGIRDSILPKLISGEVRISV